MADPAFDFNKALEDARKHYATPTNVLPFPAGIGPAPDPGKAADARLAEQVGQADLGEAGGPIGVRFSISRADTFAEN